MQFPASHCLEVDVKQELSRKVSDVKEVWEAQRSETASSSPTPPLHSQICDGMP